MDTEDTSQSGKLRRRHGGCNLKAFHIFAYIACKRLMCNDCFHFSLTARHPKGRFYGGGPQKRQAWVISFRWHLPDWRCALPLHFLPLALAQLNAGLITGRALARVTGYGAGMLTAIQPPSTQLPTWPILVIAAPDGWSRLPTIAVVFHHLQRNVLRF